MANDIQQGSARIFPLYSSSRPHVEINYDPSAIAGSATPSSVKGIAVVGNANDGNPDTVYEVTNMAQAQAIFNSGDILDALSLIWNPGGNTQGAVAGGGKVYALRVQDATPATYKNGPLAITSKVFGDAANSIAVTLDNNPINGSYRLSVSYPQANYSQTYDNLGQLYHISYVGDQAYATFEVASTQGVATAVSLKVGDDASKLNVVKTYDLTLPQYATVPSVMADVQTIPGFSVDILASGANNEISSSFLDVLQSQNLKVAVNSNGVPTPKVSNVGQNGVVINANTQAGNGTIVTASLGDIIDKLTYDPYISVSAATRSMTISNFSANLAGAATGNAPISWADKFSLLAQTDAFYVVPLTSSASVHAELKAFMADQEQIGNNFRAFVGGGFNETASQSINRQINLKDSRVALTGVSGYFSDATSGAQKHLPGFQVAALAAGVASGLPIGGSLTNKYVNLISIDQNFNSTALDNLNSNGVIAIEKVSNRGQQGGFRFVQDVTTYNSSNEPDKSRISLGEVTDFLFQDLRTDLESKFVGSNIVLTSAQLIKSEVISFLGREVANGLIVDFDANSIVTFVNGNKVYISFSVAPSQSIDFIFVKAAYSNFTATSNDGISVNQRG